MDEKEIHLRDYIRVINKRKSTVLTFLVITFTVVVIATYTATPLYEATTKVMVERNVASPLASGYGYIPYDPEFLETQYQVIKSGGVAEKVVKLLDPEKVYPVFFREKDKQSFLSPVVTWMKDLYQGVKEAIGLEALFSSSANGGDGEFSPEMNLPLTKAQELALAIKDSISVAPVPNSRVVEISFMSESPGLAMKIVNSVAQAYINELLDMRMAVSGYSIKWMTKKADEQKEKLQRSEDALQRYQRQHDIVTIQDKVTILPERLSELSSRLTVSEAERKQLNDVYNQTVSFQGSALETIPAISTNTAVDAINKQILQAEQNISELSKKFGAKHPGMIQAIDELKGLKAKKTEEIQKAVQTIKNRYLLAKSNEDNLRGLLEQTKAEAANLSEKHIQLGILKREVDANRNLYDSLVSKLKEKGVTEESHVVDVWVIEEAGLPENPAKPNKKRNILLALVLGLFGGVGLAFFLEYLDNTVKSPEDIEERFDVPVIGVIAVVKDQKETIVDSVIKSSASMLSESFKSLRTSIFLSSAEKHPKTLLVTSMAPGEGKSSICACLAASVARTGKKTLLIDADMRRPVQHNNFILENASGLSSFLAGVTTTDVLQKGSVDVDHLDIVTSGPVPPNPSELLSSERMGKMIRELSEVYDMIIIDSPPIVSVSDPLILSKHVQGVILVTWAGKTTYDAVHKGLKLFKEMSTPLIGLVLNRFDARKSGYHYGYGGYGYGDYYYSSPETGADKK